MLTHNIATTIVLKRKALRLKFGPQPPVRELISTQLPMQLSVTGKRLNVGDALRGHIEKTLAASVTIYFENATDSQVTLSKDGQKLRADITVHAGNRIAIQRHAVAGDPYAAFEGATDIDPKRLRRYQRSLRDNHKRHTNYEISERMQQHFSRCQRANRNCNAIRWRSRNANGSSRTNDDDVSQQDSR